MSSAPYEPPFPDAVACTGTECAVGDAYCASVGLSCGPIADLPCFRCTDTVTASALRDDFRVQDGETPADRLFCEQDADCPAGARCIQHRCLTESQIDLLPPFCGNTRIDPGEQCDAGVENSDKPNAPCRPDCTLSRCGDGILDTPLERCDDGNRMDGDGCSSFCQKERSAAESPYPGSVLDIPFLPPEGSVFVPGSDATRPPATSDTGPAAIAVMAAGAAAGWAWVRRRRK